MMAMLFTTTSHIMLLCSTASAMNGSLGDLELTHQLQTRFGPHKVARMVRVRFCFGYAGIFFGYLLAPALYDLLPVRAVIVGCGIACAIAGAAGLVFLRRKSLQRQGSIDS